MRILVRELLRKYLPRKSPSPEWILDRFKTELLLQLADTIRGIYIIGSYALHDVNPSLSDLDFIVSIDQELTESQIHVIQSIHTRIEQEAAQPNLNGLYIREDLLGKTSEEIEQLTYFHEGVLKTAYYQDSYFEIHPITWAELKLHGVTLYGKKSTAIDLQLDWAELDFYMYENINSYWDKWIRESNNYRHPYYYLTLFRRSENAWCVAGVARQLYSLEEQKITSKRKACEYWLYKVPQQYVPILTDTISYRQGIRSRRSWHQKKETLAFMRYCVARFNATFEEKYGSHDMQKPKTI